jgi:protein O-GlcNAc transferase
MATIAETLAVALDHHQAGRLPEAEGICRQILTVEPHHADAWHLLGVIAHQAGRHETAIEHIRHAIELNDTDPLFHNNLGEAYRARQMLAEAIACYRRALELDPTLVDAHRNLGLALQAQGQSEEAMACYRRALGLKPNFPKAYCNLGIVLRQKGRTTEAMDCFSLASTLLNGGSTEVTSRTSMANPPLISLPICLNRR